jgi:hypothetical protein
MPNTSHVQRFWIIQSSKEPTTNIAPIPPAGVHTPVKKEARESNLSGETALDVEIPETYVIFLCYSP